MLDPLLLEATFTAPAAKVAAALYEDFLRLPKGAARSVSRRGGKHITSLKGTDAERGEYLITITRSEHEGIHEISFETCAEGFSAAGSATVRECAGGGSQLNLRETVKGVDPDTMADSLEHWLERMRGSLSL